MIWIDFETNPSSNCGWGNDFVSNCQFMEDLVADLKAEGKSVGIYASHYMWTQIMGTATYCSKFTQYPLWYAHYDNLKSFEDYAKLPFGGWTKPAIKQFDDGQHQKICGLTIDQDWYP